MKANVIVALGATLAHCIKHRVTRGGGERKKNIYFSKHIYSYHIHLKFKIDLTRFDMMVCASFTWLQVTQSTKDYNLGLCHIHSTARLQHYQLLRCQHTPTFSASTWLPWANLLCLVPARSLLPQTSGPGSFLLRVCLCFPDL